MADWRQIQARIRKAKNSREPVAKLSELYQRTRDGMVAWEIGAVEEKNGRSDEAVRWYKVAAEKFRRADWKKKAEDALARLGVEAPAKQEAAPEEELAAPNSVMIEEETVHEELAAPLAVDEIEDSEDAENSAGQQFAQPGAGPAAIPQQGMPGDGMRKKRRRGRRGGRGRRRKGGVDQAPGLPAQAFASSSSSGANAAVQPAPHAMAAATSAAERAPHEAPQRELQRPVRGETVYEAPQLPSERAAHGRSDPALSSRMAQLESLLRRLMQSPLHRLGEADEAPAGPGVFLLSDSDQLSAYYIEACQTLRVGVSNLVRGQRSSRSRNLSETNLKERLAEYLGINEAKVSQYLKDHCVVRWIQLDDEAGNLAHFAIGILRTPLNID
ncbi:MAG TPA: hypothetical protein VMB47_19860 [Candidatus Aquilonibacter sp.]|nr:hypothetical protein [Candidatus Aquilonibacter sp.]